MGHQQQSDTASHSNGLPAKLPALDAILPRDMEWIVEYHLAISKRTPCLRRLISLLA
jgi:hypothetical protein